MSSDCSFKNIRYLRLLRRTGVIICLIWFIMARAAATEEKAEIDYSVNNDNTIVSIPIGAGNVEGVRSLVEKLKGNNSLGSVIAFVSDIKGAAPQLILTGSEPNELDKVLKLVQMFLSEATKQKHIIVITASLKELSDNDEKNIGVNFLPPNIRGAIQRNWGRERNLDTEPEPSRMVPDMTRNGRGSSRKNLKDYDEDNYDYVEGYLLGGYDSCGNNSIENNIMKLANDDSKGKTLVESELYTTNGIEGHLVNTHCIPMRAFNKNGEPIVRSQDLVTEIKIIPIIVSYDKEKPEESRVKLDVDLKIGAFVNISKTYPITTTKSLKTTRTLKANGQGEIIGSFINDSTLNERSGIPFLSKIPLLKYLFSHDRTKKVRNISLLTLAVRILPAESL